jgi:hypothetical protein
MSTIDSANPPQEFPDIVGARPTTRFTYRFRPTQNCVRQLTRLVKPQNSSPIFIGGMVRLLVDRYLKVKFRHKNLSEMELTAEGDKSPGVLLASGYIAGGAITGIVIAAKEMVGPLAAIGHRIEEWQTAHNPFLSGPYADLLALIPFFIISLLLYLVGSDLFLVSRSKS